MRISFENADKVNGLLTITVEEADYRELVEKTLKDYRKKVNVPGFRNKWQKKEHSPRKR